MSFSVDHHIYRVETPDDPQRDPEGAQQRAQRPVTANAYVQDMMEYNDQAKRWEPAQWFINETARIVPQSLEALLKHLPEEAEDSHNAMIAMLEHARQSMESGPYTGFLYGLKDLVLRQLCSVYIWMESNDAIRISRINQGEDPASEEVQRAEEAVEKNRVAFTYYARLLRALERENEGKISLNEFAWANASKQAAWDFLGYHKRRADNPQRQHTEQRRRGPDLLMS